MLYNASGLKHLYEYRYGINLQLLCMFLLKLYFLPKVKRDSKYLIGSKELNGKEHTNDK